MDKQNPIEIDHDKLVVHLIVPLTPSLNEVNKWRMSKDLKKIFRHRLEQEAAVLLCLRQTFGPSRQEPLAKKVILHVVRCTDTNRYLDETNLIGGLKTTEDALVSNGVMPDDTPAHTSWGRIIQLKRKDWGAYKMASTHIYVERAE